MLNIRIPKYYIILTSKERFKILKATVFVAEIPPQNGKT